MVGCCLQVPHRFSLIVPVFDQPELLTQCLSSIRGSTLTDYELIVSDDGTPDRDAIRLVAEQFGARLVRSEVRTGAAAARNRAARVATGETLAFFDADVTLYPETLERMAAAFKQLPAPDAVIGSYDRQPSASNTAAQFRNLQHAYVHHTSRREAQTFWTACGAIRRDRFVELCGFDEQYDAPSIEDVELGLRLHRQGGRILLDSAIQVTHHKQWTLSSMVTTDLFRRAIPWTALLRDHSLPNDLNFRWNDRVAAVLSSLALILTAVALRHGGGWWGIVVLDLLVVGALQAPLLTFLAKCRGLVFAFLCFPLLLIHGIVCIVGLCVGLLLVEHKRDRWLLGGALAIVAAIVSLQLAGGAYKAEFNGDPDEAAHFVSGLMVHDYLAAMPSGSPVRWAEQYYLHYPKVAIGHWPPGFYLMEALWWLIFTPSRGSILALEAFIVLIAAVAFYRVARTLAPSWLAWIATAVLIASPVTQQSFDLGMADGLCLLWSVLLIDATVRLVRRPSAKTLLLASFWLVCALLTKGTAVALLPVPAVALLVTGKWKQLPRSWVLVVSAAVLSVGLAWYAIETSVLHHSLLWWGGVSRYMPWPVGLMWGLAGAGCCVLAAGGTIGALMRKQPAAVAAASVLLSAAAVSYGLRAMNQPRHWIIVLPALLLLSTEALMLVRQWKPMLIVGLVALGLFPWQVFRQTPGSFTAISRQLPRPARVLISSDAAGEGALIVAIALSESRPSSVVVRGSKFLASSGSNGENYRLRADSKEQVECLLDETGIDRVVVQPTSQGSAPHRKLLLETLEGSSAWRECVQAGALAVWCRILPPRQAQKPLRIDLTDQLGWVIQEESSSR